MTASHNGRVRYLGDFARNQKSHSFAYLYPVFFPLSAPGPSQHAFDAKQHDLLGTMRDLMNKYD
jgi:hypothetical protein